MEIASADRPFPGISSRILALVMGLTRLTLSASARSCKAALTGIRCYPEHPSASTRRRSSGNAVHRLSTRDAIARPHIASNRDWPYPMRASNAASNNWLK
jgi:hypothetical protein